jgi:hypothetical protein
MASARGGKVSLQIQPGTGAPVSIHGVIASVTLKHVWLDQALYELEARSRRMQAELESKKAEMQATARRDFAAAGLDYEAEMGKATAQAGGPPRFSADEQLVMLHDMARIAAEGGEPLSELERELCDPRYEQMLREPEARVQQGYRQAAHLMPPAPIDPAEGAMLRVQVVAAKDGGESLAGRRLIGVAAQIKGEDVVVSARQVAKIDGEQIHVG